MMKLVFMLAALAASDADQRQDDLDSLLKPVMDACVLTDMEDQSPEAGLAAAGWNESGGVSISPDGETKVLVTWPATGENTASCFVYSPRFSASDYNSWVEKQVGPATSIPWDPDTPLAGWRIEVSGHRADIYVGQGKNPENGSPTPVVHILQSE